jgi:APA family basic amino acid/polyamine antiporter
MIVLSTLCVLVPYLFAAAAYVTLSLERVSRGTSLLGIFLLGSAAFAFSMWAIFGAGENSVFWGFILLLLGTPVYVWLKWKQQKTD